MKKITHPLRITTFTLLLLIAMNICYAQKEITGRVLSKSDQSPVAGASVVVKGSKTGTATNTAGFFSIKAKEGDVLVVTGVGIRRQEINVSRDQNIIVTVTRNAKELDEVVVTASGIRKETKRLGYAIQQIQASDLTKAREPDVINSLKGNVSGLVIGITQEIGRSPSVVLRGEGSPMYVVDGVPMNSDTYNINPDDIESFTILKGPNAAALYGFQGRDGAIIITTKKGSKNKRGYQVDFNSTTQINKGYLTFPRIQNTYGPGEYGDYGFVDGQGDGLNDADYDIWGPQFKGQLIPQFDGTYNPNQTYTTKYPDGTTLVGNIQPTPWLARGKNNLKDFLQTPLLSTNSISVSSSTKKIDMRFSAGNTYQVGAVPNTELNTSNFSSSITFRFSPKLSFSSYINYTRQSSPNIPDANYGPQSEIYNLAIWSGADWSVNDPLIRNIWQPGKVGIQQEYEEYYQYNNPWFLAYEWLRGHYNTQVNGYMTMNYKINDNIDVILRPSESSYDMLNTEKLPYSADEYGQRLKEGNYSEDRRSLFETNVELQGRYHKNRILGFLDVQGLIGANVRNFKFTSDFASTDYLNVPGVYAFSNSVNPILATDYTANMLVLSAYSSLDVGYKSYITANITGRFDKSSTLPVNNNTYFYPSINLATVISEYIKLPAIISFFKIRASYADSKDGGTTSQFTPYNVVPGGGSGYTWPTPYGGPTYQFSQEYSLSPVYNNQVGATYTNTQVSNNIKTEDRKAYEAGADIRILQNRLAFDLTRYHYLNGPAIISQNLSSATGFSGYLTNGDTYTNDGWEVGVNGEPIRNPKGLSWKVNVTWFTYYQKWVNYQSAPNNYEYNGKRIDLEYGDAFVRTPDGKFVIDPGTGLLIKYSDLGSTAQRIYGHYNPDWTWGIGNTLSYKSVSLHFQFDGSVGGVVNDYVRQKTLQGGSNIETTQGAFGVARPNDALGLGGSYVGNGVNLSGPNGIELDPITGAITNMKDLTETQNTTKSNVQDYVYQYASIYDQTIISKTFAKLREVTLSFAIPKSIFGSKSFFQQASFSLVGRNLIYFFPKRYRDIDVDEFPQVTEGADLQTPTTRSFGANLNLTF